MTEQTANRKKPHILSTVAADIVSHMEYRPGTWDFEIAFAPYIKLMDLRSREAENQLSVSSAAENEARVLYLMKRAREINEMISQVEAQINAMRK